MNQDREKENLWGKKKEDKRKEKLRGKKKEDLLSLTRGLARNDPRYLPDLCPTLPLANL